MSLLLYIEGNNNRVDNPAQDLPISSNFDEKFDPKQFRGFAIVDSRKFPKIGQQLERYGTGTEKRIFQVTSISEPLPIQTIDGIKRISRRVTIAPVDF